MSESDVDDIEEFDDSEASDEFEHYIDAMLCGGAVRVAQVALLLLYDESRIRITRGTRRVEILRRRPADPEQEQDWVREAALDAIPGGGLPLKEVIAAVAASPEVAAVADGMRDEGLLRGRGLRLTRDGRLTRRMLTEEPPESRAGRLAVHGPAALRDTWLGEVLEDEDPDPVRLRRVRGRGFGGIGRYRGWGLG
ncbi:TIGR04222 domain-containing membrane protein, partial [Actinomadura sp. 7K507]|uniref:TIGR04222 domain-containing membrane protein n=1 Tax=Actinomadura sp. 7K507 TaxID=2530365 RepID=UPI001052FC65